MYTTLIFDIDNTLLNYDLCELDSMQKTCQTYGLFQDDTTAWDAFWATFLLHNARNWNKMVNGGEITTIFEVLYLSFQDTLNQSHQLHTQL
ncbi:hypothetical protein SAMN04488542_10394 [Fontibacillus panacisegetis]|uniref:Hydrolase of the HAD superfamily n=1 Tax=Fontibacillus panacisegetis TaxID=670482 RepID=A0A1G7GKD1_9BACL|nr:hypothetical protein SAMN04488542_10394 [Fontibacillus panacisegetis]